jgi:gliding motility-associated-like protein
LFVIPDPELSKNQMNLKRFLLSLMLFAAIGVVPGKLFASHGMGGEITWTCLPGGQFKFKMKFYRDCNGIPGPASVTLSTTVPGVPNIPLPLIQQNDISPDGIKSDGITTCANCNQGGFGSPIPGLVEEFIYESAPVNLPGIPPAAGWVFEWGECCRSSALTNIPGAGGIGFQNRAIMYPYNATSTLPCFDSSPYFAEKPSTIICTGYPFKYNPNAVDPEMDSLVYAWGQPLDDMGNPVPFGPGYSINSQLPGPTQNPLNVAATINAQTGEISYTSFTGGYFATVVKVTAYKCNIKVAEIFREINVVLNNNCPPVMGGVSNTPPEVNPPFFHPVTGLQTEYADTVYAGDTVNFMLTAQDFEFFNNGGPQTITVEGSGAQFGTNFTNANAGCIIPPCATMSPGLPTSFAIAGQTTFNWVTTCDHVTGLDTNCRRISNTYNFVIKASDNYCPANATNVGTFSITILPAPKLDPPVLRCASVNLDGSVSLSWTKPSPRDSQNTFHSYEIYASLAAGGPWQVVDSVKTPYLAPGTYAYTQSLASLTAMFGTNAQQQSIFYHIVTRSGCSGDSISDKSNILQTMELDVALNGSNEAVLTWNALSTPPLSSHLDHYRVYKQFPVGTWTLIDSTTLLTYTDTTTKLICDDTVSYRIELPDSSGCISVSSRDGIQVTNPNPAVVILPANPDFCVGDDVTLTCATPAVSYQWSGGLGTAASVTVSTAGTYTVTVTQQGGCTATGTTVVVANPLPTPNITGITSICAGATTTFDAGAYTSYQWSGSLGTGQFATTGTAGTYTVTVTDANGCTGTDNITLIVNPNPAPVITGVTSICQGTSTTLNAGPGFATYIWSGGLGAAQTASVSTSGTYTVTVTFATGCSGTDTETVTVNPLPVVNITGDNDICAGTTTVFDAGPGFISYQWSGGLGAGQTATTGAAGTYTVTVTDGNNCSNTDNVTLTVNPNPVPVITGTTSFCSGTSSILDAGGPYSSYQWSTGVTTQTASVNTAGPVTVTVTDVNQCTGTANTNITLYALPSATISGIDTICDGQSTTIQVNFSGPGPYTYTYFDGSANQGPFTTGAAVANISVSPTSNATYTLINVSNTNCPGSVSGSASVHVTPLPSATISGTTSICDGDNTSLTIDFTGVGPYTYSYTANGTTFGPFTTSNDPETINVTPGATTTYGMTATVVGAGCTGNTNAATAVVTVNELPTASLTGDNTICDGTSTDLTINFTGTGPFTYSYSDGSNTFGPFTTSNNPETVTVSPTLTTGYSLLSIDDANCTGSVSGTADIVVNPLPTATLSGTTQICDGVSTNLSIAFTGTGPFTYTYNDGTNSFGPFTTNLNPVSIPVSPSVTTTYGPVTISDANCTGSVSGTADITVIPLPTSTLTGTQEICNGSSATMTLDFTGVPPFEYLYTDGTNVFGPFTVLTFSTTINVTPTATTSYNLTTVTGSGCAGTPAGVVDITVNSIPDASVALSGGSEICDGESSEITLSFTGEAPFTYSYTDGSTTYGPFTTSNGIEIIPVSPGSTVNYSLVSFTDDNCTGTMNGTAQVIVHPLPEALTAGSQEICFGSGTTFTIDFTGTAPYIYSYSDGSTTFGPFSTSNNPESIAVAPSLTTTYNIVSVSDAFCTGTVGGTSTVTVNEIPTAAITGDATICDGESTQLTLQFTGEAPFTFTCSNGTNNLGPFTVPNATYNYTVSPGSTVTYTIVSMSDDNCVGTFSGSALVNVNPLPQPQITGDFEICDGESSVLEATAGFVSYLWSTGATSTSVVATVGGSYAVTVTDQNGCSNSIAENFIVNMTPVASFTDTLLLTCSKTALKFKNTSLYPPGSDFLWDFGDGTSSTEVSPVHPYELPGTYQVTLYIVTPAGCTDSITRPADIIFFPLAEAKFSADPVFSNVFNAKVTFADESEYAVSWMWEFGDGITSFDQNPVHYYNEVGEYVVRLTVQNIAGCPDTYESVVVVNPFYIPNAFTPNADGINDYFFDAGYVMDVKSYKMSVFNRWGQKIYESADYTKFWNGFDSNGEPVQNGVYVYALEVITKGGKEHTFQGQVTLVR